MQKEHFDETKFHLSFNFQQDENILYHDQFRTKWGQKSSCDQTTSCSRFHASHHFFVGNFDLLPLYISSSLFRLLRKLLSLRQVLYAQSTIHDDDV